MRGVGAPQGRDEASVRRDACAACRTTSNPSVFPARQGLVSRFGFRLGAPLRFALQVVFDLLERSAVARPPLVALAVAGVATGCTGCPGHGCLLNHKVVDG